MIPDNLKYDEEEQEKDSEINLESDIKINFLKDLLEHNDEYSRNSSTNIL